MEDRERILEAARANLERLADLKPRERRINLTAGTTNVAPEKRRAAGASNEAPELTEYERAVQQSGVWQAWVGGEIREAMMTVAQGVATEVRSALDSIDEAIHARDEKVRRLELELVKAQAQIAKLELRMAEADVERDRREREWTPTPTTRRELN
jgi:hypothetical protein